MRIVHVLPFFSFPPRDGLSIRVWQTLTSLSARHDIDVVLPDRALTDELSSALRPLVRSVTSVPTSPRHDRGKATRQDTIRDALTYPPTMFRAAEQQQLATTVFGLLTREPQVDWLLCETQISAQIALYPGFPEVRRCLCLHDVYAEYVRRKVQTTPWRPYKAKLALEVWKVRRYETRIMRRFGLVTVVNPDEEQIVRARARDTEVALVPNGVDSEYFRPGSSTFPPRESSPGMLFIGNLSYEPNEDAMRYFLSEILPIIRQSHPSVRLVIAGKDPPSWLRTVGDIDEAVTVTGTVPDVRPYYHASHVVVAPLRIGGGTKLKILEALAMGKPVVTTPAGAAGLAVESGRHLLVGADAPSVARHVGTILDSDVLARRLGTAGRQLVTENYTWSPLMTRFEEILERGAGQRPGSESPTLTSIRG